MVERYTSIFKILGDPLRLNIFLLLSKDRFCVCELEYVLEVEQSRVSHALRGLKSVNLVWGEKKEQWIFYSLTEEAKKDKVLQKIVEVIEIDERIKERWKKLRSNDEFWCKKK